MRSIAIVVGLGGMLLSLPLVQAADSGPAGSSREAAIEQLARETFAEADNNRNRLLNRIEFGEAQQMLAEAISSWQPPRVPASGPNRLHTQRHQRPDQPASLTSALMAEKLAKSNRISPAEFTFYVHTLVDDLEQSWRRWQAMPNTHRGIPSRQQALPPKSRAKTGPRQAVDPPANR